MSNVCVIAIDKTSGGFVRGDCPDAGTGAYTINRLPPGKYRLRAFSPEAGFVNQFYGAGGTAEADFEGAADVVVTNNGNNSGKNFTMVSNPGQIWGTVREANSGTPIMGASISIRTPNANYHAGGDTSRADGSFIVRGLAPGVYKVRMTHPDYGTRWFTFTGGAGASRMRLVPVVANNHIVDINVDLDANPGSITGRVTTNVLSARRAHHTCRLDERKPQRCVRINITGGRHLRSTRVGPRNVHCPQQHAVQRPSPYRGPDLCMLFYSNKGSRETADPVTVTAGINTPNIDFVPSPTFGSLSGRVTKSDGTTGIALAIPMARDAATGNRVYGTEADSTGNFTISQSSSRELYGGGEC